MMIDFFHIIHRTPLNDQRVLWMFPKSGKTMPLKKQKKHWQIIETPMGKSLEMEASSYMGTSSKKWRNLTLW